MRDRCLEIISGETDEIGTWKEGFAIRLAGEMKLEEAIPLMMATLHEIPDELDQRRMPSGFCQDGF